MRDIMTHLRMFNDSSSVSELCRKIHIPPFLKARGGQRSGSATEKEEGAGEER